MMRAAGPRRWRSQLLLARAFSSSEGPPFWQQQQHAAWQSNVPADAQQHHHHQQQQHAAWQSNVRADAQQHYHHQQQQQDAAWQSNVRADAQQQQHHQQQQQDAAWQSNGRADAQQQQHYQQQQVQQGSSQFAQGNAPTQHFVQGNAPSPQFLEGSNGAPPSPQFVQGNPNIGQVSGQFAGFAPGQGNGVPQQGIQGNPVGQHRNQQDARNAAPSSWDGANYRGSSPANSGGGGQFASPSNAAAQVRDTAGYGHDTSAFPPMGGRGGPVLQQQQQQQQQQPVSAGVGGASATPWAGSNVQGSGGLNFGGGSSAQRSPLSGGGNGQQWFSNGPPSSSGGGPAAFGRGNQGTQFQSRPTAGGQHEIQNRQGSPVSQSQFPAQQDAGHFSASFLSDSVSENVSGPRQPAYNPIPGISARPHQSGRSASPLIQDIVKGLTRSATDPVQGSEPVLPRHLQMPEKKVVARLSVLPRFALKSDIMSYFSDCNLEEQDLKFIYDDKYRARFMQIEFKNQDHYRTALKTLSDRGRLGGRFMKLELDSEFEMDEINNVVQTANSHVLLMDNIPKESAAEELDRFFHGYDLGSQGVRILRSRVVPWSKAPPERRAAAHFDTYLKASRALREKQGEFCGDRPVELRYLQV